jgi:hypothetical protein
MIPSRSRTAGTGAGAGISGGTVAAILAVAIGVVPAGAGDGNAGDVPGESEPLPPGVVQIIPRGRLAAVFEPEFVPAEEAGLPDSAYVLGVEMDGEAHAYSLNLLNHHEVVNDRIGETPFAAVW